MTFLIGAIIGGCIGIIVAGLCAAAHEDRDK